MSTSEETHLNLTVRNNTRVNNLIITGNLDVDLTKLHVQNSGNFVSDEFDGHVYTLTITGDNVTLTNAPDVNPTLITVIAELTDPGQIPYSDMHYAHKLNTAYSYRFLSDMETILLTKITEIDGATKTIVLKAPEMTIGVGVGDGDGGDGGGGGGGK